MDKTAIKNFATWARNELIDKVSQKAKIYGIEKDKEIEREMDTALNEQILSPDEKKARRELINKIEENSFDQVIEEVAYTWFNRFIAIRFMEVNGYMPSHIRVFTSEDNEFEPQILSEVIHIDLPGLDKSKVLDFYNAGNKEEELFNYLFITQCNALNEVLPGIFQKISDYTELLIPDGLLREGSVIDRLIKDIKEEDWKEQVQIIGWLYQYYNEEWKDEVINIYKGNVSKGDIPAATQLFTPDWIVRYIVDNSLGRYWIERNPESKLIDKLEFFIPKKNGEIEYIEEKIDPRELKVLDNCVGSGHFLVYEFDVLMEIYKECGYREREAAEYILKENLFGIDIDERARQLAYFSVMMKARSFNRRILEKDIEPNIYAVTESNKLDKNNLKEFGNTLIKEEREEAQKAINYLLDTFEDAKNYGSIIKIERVNLDLCRKFINDIDLEQLSFTTQDLHIFKSELDNIINLADLMTMKYDIVATNPPYLNRMNDSLKKYVNKHYKEYKTDLFSVFMYHNFDLCKVNGYSGFMTPLVWMFIKSYEKLRNYIVDNKNISSLIQMEYSAFEEATVPICAFVFGNNSEEKKGSYIRLSEFKGGMKVQKEKVLNAIKNPKCDYLYETSKTDFKKIPGSPIAYWASDKLINTFESQLLYDYSASPGQNVTGNNKRFLRKHWELNSINVGDKDSWIFYAKGGGFRKWHGNLIDVINWKPEARNIYRYGDGKHASSIINEESWYKKGITWGLVTSSFPSFRIMPEGATFDKGGSTIIVKDDLYNFTIGMLNSKVFYCISKIMNPTINFQVRDIRSTPFIYVDNQCIDNLVIELIKLSKLDWDMHETSWDFEKSPLIKNKIDGRIESAYQSYKSEVNERFKKLKENEEELNRIFIEIYGLEDELDPYVSDKDITVAKIFDDKKDIDDEIKGNRYVMTRENVVKNFLSYFIGCAMGRYSLDEDGLIFAGGDFDPSKYKSFKASEDGIISLTDKEYFEDDILALFVDFLKASFGEENLNENLDFIAAELTKKSYTNSREVIRNYFINDFYKDHCKMYQKLPIYWQYDSGKANACKGLFYLHRYEKDTFAKIRINYIFELQDRYKQEVKRLEESLKLADEKERIGLQKEIDSLKKRIIESEKFEEKIQHIADSYIEIDLDDGVKENYKIFKDVLSKI